MINPSTGEIGSVVVLATQGRGLTPSEIAKLATNKILSVSRSAPPPLRDQAQAFKDDIYRIIAHYMHEAVEAHNVTLVAKFKRLGYENLVPIIDA